MLESVLKAIADLKESQGSTVRNIINHIKSNPEKQTGRRKYDITSQVRRALTQGKNAGVIVHNAKKYRLTTTPSKCSNLLARSYAGKRSKKSRRRRKGRSRRKKRRRSESASVSEASDHPSEGSSAQGGDGAVTEVGRRRRRSKSRGRNRRSRRRRQQEESCDDRTDDDDDVEENSRKRPRHSDSDKGNSFYTQLPICFQN